MSTAPDFSPRDGRLPGLDAPPPPGEPESRRDGRKNRRWLELLLALLLALLCFCVVLLVLDRLFPSATGLGELLRAERSAWNDGSGSAGADPHSGWAVAVLTILNDKVLKKGSGSIAWDPAANGGNVRQGDGVQTTRDGMAVVTFDREDWLRIGRNSLVILEHPEEPGASSQTASLTLVSGEMWGELGGGKAGSVRILIAGSKHPVRLSTETGPGAPSRFKVALLRDHTAIVTVYAGRVAVTVGERTARLESNQYVRLRRDELDVNVRTLPAAPVASAPVDGLECRFREFPPALRFRWTDAEPAERHRLAVARDAGFRDEVLDEVVAGSTIAFSSLAPGKYWWRVSAQRDGVEGAPSLARRMSLVLDNVPPPLQVNFPVAPVALDRCRIEGVTEPGAWLRVAGTRVRADAAGHFACETPLRPGTNLVVVEAVDAVGNSTYRSRIVRCAIHH